ncbi:hypothetical protein SAMD00019534_057350, partial [Acytostelium subglobosum LB1]|uniref:hypothetical protein n=1 Tax=Acytostelium subglobosum LB1 TaxID=1410327 RepID=UPI000644F390
MKTEINILMSILLDGNINNINNNIYCSDHEVDGSISIIDSCDLSLDTSSISNNNNDDNKDNKDTNNINNTDTTNNKDTNNNNKDTNSSNNTDTTNKDTNNNNNNNNSFYCDKHNRKQNFICYNCGTLSCQLCLSLSHYGHKFEHIKNIKYNIDNENYQALWCGQRLVHLQKIMQQCGDTYESLSKTHAEISNQFEQLFKLLMAEEHRIKSAINEKMAHIESTINDIVNEICDFEAILKKSLVIDGPKLAQSIKVIASCPSIDQFIDTSLSFRPDDKEAGAGKELLTDNELLAMIKNHKLHMDLVPYGPVSILRLRPWTIRTDEDKIYDIKKKVKTIFELVAPSAATGLVAQTNRSLVNHVLSLGCREYSMFSLQSMKWSIIRKETSGPCRSVQTAIVYASGSAYIFGGRQHPSNYCKYTLATNTSTYYPINGIIGCRSISACHDGDKHIYIIGGEHESKTLNRVDCFNIETVQFNEVGNIPVGLFQSSTYFLIDTLYIVGGIMNDNYYHLDIISFNVRTHVSTVIVKDVGGGAPVLSSCFDGSDNIFILTDKELISYSLSNQQSTKLAKHPTDGKHVHRIIYDGMFGILYIGGKGMNYRYSEEKWTLLEDNDHIPNRNMLGACLIHD